MNADDFESFLISVLFWIDRKTRAVLWELVGMPTVVIKTNAGFEISRYASFDSNGMFASDTTGRIGLNDDGTTDRLFATSWSWAPWCHEMALMDHEMKSHWIARVQERGEIRKRSLIRD